jgi:hypothetical protein
MFLIAAFGLLLMVFSIMMVINPGGWSKGIISFSQKPYFHPFEIISRAAFGMIFIYYSKQTLYPNFILGMGYLLVAVGIGLLVIGSIRHRQFALWSATKFKRTFRPSGFFSFIFGVFLVYAALSKTAYF